MPPLSRRLVYIIKSSGRCQQVFLNNCGWRPPAAEAFAQGAGVRRQQKRPTKAQAANRTAGAVAKAQAASRTAGAVAKAQAAAGNRSGQPRRRRSPKPQVRKSTFRPNRTPRSPVSSLWAGGQRRAGCGICENAFSALGRFRNSSRKGYMIRFLFPGPA